MQNCESVVLILVTLVTLVQCDLHSLGLNVTSSDNLIEQKFLFNSDSSTPQNYTVIYKSVSKQYLQPFYYVEINIENNYSIGNITIVEDTIEATINIINGTMVTVKLSIYGFPFLYMMSAVPPFVKPKLQSFTMVQIQNSTQTTFKRNAIGRRQQNDRLIYFKSHNVTRLGRFADKEFEFYGNGKQNVTCVGFSFSSPTAVAFLNSTFIKSNEIAAIVYDLSAPHFVANMSVFGYENLESIPGSYKQIVDWQ